MLNVHTLADAFSDFNPLSPSGERLQAAVFAAVGAAFQSTLPERGETCQKEANRRNNVISIHSPRMGRDRKAWEEWDMN